MLVVRFTAELARSCRREQFVRDFLHRPARRARRSTSARASSSATSARGTWRCCARWGRASASRRIGVEEVTCGAASGSPAPASAAPSPRARWRTRRRCSAVPYADHRQDRARRPHGAEARLADDQRGAGQQAAPRSTASTPAASSSRAIRRPSTASPTSARGRRCTRTTSGSWRATSSTSSQDVYGERVEVSFHKRLREERIFPTVMDLSAQIGRDVEATREYFVRRRLEQEGSLRGVVDGAAVGAGIQQPKNHRGDEPMANDKIVTSMKRTSRPRC